MCVTYYKAYSKRRCVSLYSIKTLEAQTHLRLDVHLVPHAHGVVLGAPTQEHAA